MVVKLVSATGEETQLNVGVEISIGRDKKICKICLPVTAEGVSRRHASLLLSAEGVLTLTDSSSFGTYINGSKVNKTKKVLENGDRILVGEASFTVIKKQPTSPGLMLKPVDFKQSFRKNATPKSKKTPVITESQRKMSEFFRPSQSVKSTLVLAEDTPYSQIVKTSPSNSRSFVKDTAKASDQNLEIVIDDDDDDDFCLTLSSMKTTQVKNVIPLKTIHVQPKAKSSLFSKQPTQKNFLFNDVEVLAADTVDFKDSYPKENNSAQKTDIVVDTMMHWGETKNETLARDTCFSPNETRKNSTNSLLYPGFPPSFAQPEVRKGVKRSVLYPMRNAAVSNISSLALAPSEPPPKRKSFLTMPTMVDDAVYEETKILTDSNISIFDTREKPSSQKSKRGRKPVVELKEEEKYSHASVTPNRELLRCIYSGQKYEEEEEEEEKEDPKHELKPKFKKIEVQSVVNKMDKLILFVDMERSETSASESKLNNVSGFPSYSSCSNHVNFKKFKKASQGKFNNTRKSMSILGGSNDLVDFRSI
ncbi:unnamed protein product [Auanema sp. JU1783]|nr:unnamed protein product [Auanema sp. JU1783]